MVLHQSVDGLARLLELRRHGGQQIAQTAIKTTCLLPLLALKKDTALLDSFVSTNPNININACSELFGNALYAAAAVDYRSIMQCLLDHGANVDIVNGK